MYAILIEQIKRNMIALPITKAANPVISSIIVNALFLFEFFIVVIK